MAAMMRPDGRTGLERSCAGGNWFRSDVSRPGFERVEVCFATQAFTPHRHDTYTIGVTLRGVQGFDYRGCSTRSLAGQAFVLHPDELHDGRPEADGGFRYRALYVEPRLIQDALGAASLPFVRDAVTDDPRLRAAILAALEDPEIAIDDLHFDHGLVRLADAMAALDPASKPVTAETPNLRAVKRAREVLDADPLAPVPSKALERITGLSRFALTRQFRACLGTTPHRYLVMRRLDRAKSLIRGGTPLAEAAMASGFADQAHMTRHFKKAFGVAPGRWSAMATA
jgi:AraC-like DNA-binding protein